MTENELSGIIVDAVIEVHRELTLASGLSETEFIGW